MEDIESNFDIFAFLIEYEKFPCLWNKVDPDFRNKQIRNDAKESLMISTNIQDLNILSRIIKNIKYTYNQEVNKVKNSLKDGNVYTSDIIWFNSADKFFKSSSESSSESSFEVLAGGSSDCDLTYADFEYDDTDICNEQITTDLSSHQMKSQIATYHNEEQFNLSPNNNSDDTSSSIPLLKKSSSAFKKRNKSTSENDFVSILKNQLHYTNQNEFIAFGNSVAVQLQRMPLELALELQAEIQTLISNKRLQHLRMSSSVVND